MDIPEQFRTYDCCDYFQSDLALNGYWDEASQLWLIEPWGRVEEDVEAEFLQVGRPGVDGIAFGYRKGHSGLWAFRPIDAEFHYLAPSIQDFLKGWNNGSITV